MLNERKNVKQKISQDEQLFSRQNDVGSKKQIMQTGFFSFY